MIAKQRLEGTLQVPGDKSISHRALMFSLFAEGNCRISRLSPAEDCRSTIACLLSLGVTVSCAADGEVIVNSCGLGHLASPRGTLNAGNSGTTIRLLCGLLAGTGITASFDGDSSLRKRPMARVLKPLMEMGLQVEYHAAEGCPPFTIKASRNLKGRRFDLPIASAQVQTAILLAGLQAEGVTTVAVPHPVRNHTERMFRFIGIPFDEQAPLTTSVRRLREAIPGFAIKVAGDISSAAFFMVAAACLKGSRLTLTDVGINQGRTLVIDVLREMGAQILVENQRQLCGEPVADITVSGTGVLTGATIAGARVAAGIDEIPILGLAGAFCRGTLSVRDARELRVKESDRLQALCENLRQAGARIEEVEDGFDLEGTGNLAGGSLWRTFGDHRLAMTGMVASLLCGKPVTIDDTACAAVSYPQFERDLESLLV